MSDHGPPDFNAELRQYLSVATQKYEACLDALPDPENLTGPTATVRFHHLRVDGHGVPKFDDLAKVLVDHAALYCFSARRRGDAPNADDHARHNREARSFFRNVAKSGEAGEMLLYFLLEAVLGAPQLIAKMELKTNPSLEGHGSDGIHLNWNQQAGILEMYFGEAKLEKSISSALSHMLESVESLHRQGLLDHEIGLVTSHYKYANEKMRQQVLRLIDRQDPASNFRITHACLIGYDCDKYASLGTGSIAALEKEFRIRYTADRPRLVKLLRRRLESFTKPELRFEVFFLPFRNVQEFRDAFNAVL
jgi:hypothetical protein